MALRDVYARHESADRYDAPRRATRPAATDQPGLIAIIWRRRLVALVTMLLVLGAGIVYIVVTPPRYLASTSMLIDPRLGKTVGSDPLQPGYIPDTSAMDSQIKLFTSQTVLERVAKMAHLADVPEFNGSQRSLLQRLLHPRLSLAEKVDLVALDDAITIKRPERTYVVGIDVLARDPQVAADIANDLTKAYIEDQVTSRLDAAKDDSSFVRERLDTLAAQLKQAEDKVEAYKIKNNIVDANGLRSNEQQVVDLTKALGDARAKALAAKAQVATIDRMARSGHLDAMSEALHSQTIERLRQQQAETDQSVARLAETLGPNHPALKEAEARKRELQTLIRAELLRLKLGAQQDYQTARQTARQIVAGVDGLKAESAKMNSAMVPLEALERNVRVLRSSFERFAQVNDSLSQQEGDSPPGRVIAVARPPVSPARPKKALVGILSLAGGLFFGLAAALFAESLDPQQPAPVRQRDRVPEPPMPSAPPRRPVRRYWDDDDLEP